MLSNLKIRNKLIAILAAPVVALVVLAGIGANQRNETASRGARDTKIIRLAEKLAVAAHELEVEGTLSVQYLASPSAPSAPTIKKSLAKQRKATDAAVTALTKEIKAFGLKSLSTATRNEIETLTVTTDLVPQRGQVDTLGESWSASRDSYKPTADALIQIVQDLAGETSTPAVVSALQGFGSLTQQSARAATLNMTMVGVVLQKKWYLTNAADTSGGISAADGVSEAQLDYSNGLDGFTLAQNLLQGTSSTLSNAIDSTLIGSSAVDFSNLQTLLTAQVKSTPGKSVSTEGLEADKNTFTPSVLSYAPKIGDDAVTQLGQYRTLELKTGTQLEQETVRLEKNADRAAQFFILFAGLIVLLAIAAAVVVARSITRPVNKLTAAAHRLSREQLPRLVDSLKNPAEDDVGYLAASFTPIDVSGRDEVGQLADAFNGVQEVAVNVATEQASLLRKGIGDMFVNLARRNQTLLDRQIEFIDQLESKEEDPDQLENLFRLDHLATRMRRNAESLLVLAGAEPNRRRGKPVPLADVVRAAVGEVEDFARIDMLQFDEVLVASNAALDIAHLLSELMENAANFSPPDTRVEVVGHRTKAEGYVISIADHGIGMAPEQVNEANELLSRPPLVGLALSRSLGFIVIGRLASRFGIAVRLMPSPSGGTTAMVSLPPTLITDQPKSPSGPGAIKSGTTAPELPSAPDDLSTLGDSGPAPKGGDTPARRKPAAASSAPGDVASLAAEAKAAEKAPPSAPRRAGSPGRTRPAAKSNGASAPAAAAPSAPAPAAGNGAAPAAPKSAAGLTKRVPRAAGGERAVPGGENVRAATTTRRSPEEVRSMLSNYRSGMQRGRSGDDATNPSEDEKS